MAALVAVVLAIGVAGCGGGSDPAAITVNGQEFGQSAVERELRTIADSPELKPFVVKANGDLQASVARTWLTGLVEAEVAKHEVAKRHLKVSESDRTIGERRAVQLFGQASVFDSFPEWFKNILRTRYANAAAVIRANAPEPTDEAVRAQFEKSVEQSCASHRFVSHILVATQEEAQAIVAQLAAGADFAQLAAQSSTDTASGQSGGDLACLDGQQLDPAFQAAADALPVGGTSGPVQSQFGWHIIRVRDVYDAIPFVAVKDAIRNDLATSDPAGRDKLLGLMRTAKVKVDRSYGRWVVDKDSAEVEALKKAKKTKKKETSTESSSTSSSSTPTTLAPAQP